MKPSEATQGTQGNAGETPPAVSVCLHVLKKRTDFLACNKGNYRGVKGFVLQARDRRDGTTDTRVGFTCSKKVGNAVARNRAKRRLREVARLTLPHMGRAGWDYVLIGKREVTATRDFQVMLSDMKYALKKVHE
jgi:ribonuclease P protein component